VPVTPKGVIQDTLTDDPDRCHFVSGNLGHDARLVPPCRVAVQYNRIRTIEGVIVRSAEVTARDLEVVADSRSKTVQAKSLALEGTRCATGDSDVLVAAIPHGLRRGADR
jgi:hypothetical protein